MITYPMKFHCARYYRTSSEGHEISEVISAQLPPCLDLTKAQMLSNRFLFKR